VPARTWSSVSSALALNLASQAVCKGVTIVPTTFAAPTAACLAFSPSVVASPCQRPVASRYSAAGWARVDRMRPAHIPD